jgi:DNA-binding transcriptional ArsR family regulator
MGLERMTPEAAELISRRFRALSDPTRLRILYELRERGEMSVGELTEALGTSQQNVSKHLSTLSSEGFIGRRKDKTRALYSISDKSVLDLCERVCSGIETQISEIESLLA